MFDVLKSAKEIGDVWAIRQGVLVALQPTSGPKRIKADGAGDVAAIPLHGPITQRSNIFTEYFGGTSTEQFAKSFDAALNDPAIGSILIDVDSPGGSVYGIQELADRIYAGGLVKPIVAVANSEAASAAYWLASQATELVVTTSGQVGSIGVVAIHMDHSGMLAEMGVKPTIVKAGKHKAEFNPYEPLSEDDHEALQSSVNSYYAEFIKAVARGRGVKASDVRGGFGQGRMVMAKDAVAEGMADRVASYSATLSRLMGRKTRKGRLAAVRSRLDNLTSTL